MVEDRPTFFTRKTIFLLPINFYQIFSRSDHETHLHLHKISLWMCQYSTRVHTKFNLAKLLNLTFIFLARLQFMSTQVNEHITSNIRGGQFAVLALPKQGDNLLVSHCKVLFMRGRQTECLKKVGGIGATAATVHSGRVVWNTTQWSEKPITILDTTTKCIFTA